MVNDITLILHMVRQKSQKLVNLAKIYTLLYVSPEPEFLFRVCALVLCGRDGRTEVA